MAPTLSIIIPAYKAGFLERALRSLAPQLGLTARLYIFDDASPEPIREIVTAAQHGSDPRWNYHRFDDNLGGTALVRHYRRCIARTREPWIWLFSDDDLADPNCVESFLRTLAETQARFDLYCFNSLTIDADDRATALHPTLPVQEGWKQFAYHFFRGHRTVPQQAMVFSRAAYDAVGGLVDFPAGWAADQATLMALAGTKGIRAIPGARVHFRESGVNISSSRDRALAAQKFQAAMEFTTWVIAQMKRVPDDAFPLSDDVLRQQAFHWFRQHLRALRTWYNPAQCRKAAAFLAAADGESYPRAVARMARLDAALAGEVLFGWLAQAWR